MRYKKEIVTPAPDSHVYLKDIMQLDVDIFNAYCDAHLEPGHDWGPQIRDHYVLEYCIHGRG